MSLFMKFALFFMILYSTYINAQEFEAKTVFIDSSITLQKKATYNDTVFKVKSSNITLDCNNSILSNSKILFDNIELSDYLPKKIISNQKNLIAYLQKDTLLKEKITNDLLANRLSNISIKNCIFVNNKYTPIIIDNRFPNLTVRNIGLNLNSSQMSKVAAKNITLDNVKILDSGSGGVFIGDHVLNTKILNSTFINIGAMAIYLELNSHKSVISNSTFTNNGKTAQREAISIDTSADNVIENNYFSNNYLGSIKLYKNCVEQNSNFLSIPNFYPRSISSSRNIIRHNTFVDEKIAIHIASRQDYNMKNIDCGEQPIYTSSIDDLKINSDFSDYNFIYSNIFKSDLIDITGIRSQDDNNLIIANIFNSSKNSTFFIGGSKSRLLHDIRGANHGNTVINNIIPSSKNYKNTYQSSGLFCDNYTELNLKALDRPCRTDHFQRSNAYNFWLSKYPFMDTILKKKYLETLTKKAN